MTYTLRLTTKIKDDLILLLTAIIWGFAFVAQRIGMQNVGPFTYNGIRFFIGSTALLPLLFYYYKKDKSIIKKDTKLILSGGLVCGIVLFIGASFQQVGLQFTTAGKAGFITGLYIIIVPFIGIFLHHKIKINNWIGAFIATIGLYLLSGAERFILQRGDFLVFISAIFWAVHILVIGYFSPKMNPILLSCLQFYVCSFLCLGTALIHEQIMISNIFKASLPILYGGLLSIGVAYTLQVVAQKTRPPEDASIILSLEALFAVIGGWLILSENLSITSIIGCLLMLAGIILSQISFSRNRNDFKSL